MRIQLLTVKRTIETMFDDVIIFLIFFGGFTSLNIAVGRFFEVEKKASDYFFTIFMLCLGSSQLLDGLLALGKLKDYPSLFFLHLPVIASLGPLYYISFKYSNSDSFQFRGIDSLHFLWAFMTLALMLPLLALDDGTRISFLMRAPNFAGNDPYFRLYSGLFIAGILNLVGYQLYFVKECFFMLNIRLFMEKKVSPYLVLVILFGFPVQIVLFGIIIAMSMLEYQPSFFFRIIQLLTALSFLPTLAIFILEKKNIDYFRLLNTEIEERKYLVSKTKNLDITLLLPQIEHVMCTEKAFQDENLSVSTLAGKLSIEPYQLSQIINEKFNKNFNYFINSYRIEEAKNILIAEKERTITSVAYLVGFNSISVFNDWFKRITGVSPKMYRNNN